MTAGRRDQLASALVQWKSYWFGDGPYQIAEALLPTVDAMIRQAQAEALESAARMAAPNIASAYAAVGWFRATLRDRAAAIRLSTDRPDVTQDAP